MSRPSAQQRLVDRRGSRRSTAARWSAGPRRCRRSVVERVEVGDVGLALGAALPVDVEADLVDVVALGDELARQVVGGVGDDRDVRHPRHPTACDPTLTARCRTTLVTGATGSRRVARRARAASRAATTCARARARPLATRRPRRPRRRARRPATCSTARGAPGDARRRPRVPHRRHDVAARPRPTWTSRSTSTARGSCSRRRCGRAWSASSTPRRWPRSGPRARGSTADEDQVFDAGALRHPLRQRQARGRGRGAAAGRARAAGGDRQPRRTCSARGDRQPLLDRARAALPAPPDPGLRRRRAQHRRRPRTSPAATCWPTSAARSGERYILGNRNFTLDRLFADLARLSGVEPPAVKLPLHGRARARARPQARLPGPAAGHDGRGPRLVAVVGVPQDEGQARARLAPVARTRTPRGDDRLVPRARGRAPGAARHAPAAAAARGRGPACAGAAGSLR